MAPARSSAARRMTSATSISRTQLRPADHAGRPARTTRMPKPIRRRPMPPMSTTARIFNSRIPRRPDDRRGQGSSRQPSRVANARRHRPSEQRKVNYPPARLGHFAPALLGLPDPDHPLRRPAASCPVPKQDLPVSLPDDVTFDMPGNPLDRHPTWKHVDCPTCGKPARRETDTMDTFVDSSWYFARFTDPCDDRARRPRPRDRQWLAAGRPVYRRYRARDPAPALFALLHPRHDDAPAMPA